MKKLFRKCYKSRSQWFNGALIMSGLVQANVEEFRQIIHPSYFGLFIIGVGMVGWYLRTITTTPMEEK